MAIFDIRSVFITRPPPSHSRLCGVCFVCVEFLGAIVESVRHLSFSKYRDFYGGVSEKKKAACFFCGGKRKKRNIFYKTNK